MKRYILFISFLFFTILGVYGQDITNQGPLTITTAVVWNSYDIIYINGTITISAGGSLTIAPNTTGPNAGAGLPVHVAFTAASYGITNQSSGIFNVSGTSSRKIFFTTDYGKDGTYGGSGETWRNLFFFGSTGTSVINYADIELGTGTSSAGGGIYVAGGRNLTISNSSIHNCASTRGGGINVNASGTVTLQNLSIHDNSATTEGGGLYIRGNLVSAIDGCDIYSNSSPAGTGGGIFFYNSNTVNNCSIHGNTGGGVNVSSTASGTSLRNSLIYSHTSATGVLFATSGNLVNCDILNNGTGVNSTSGTAPVLLNDVLWGNTTVQYTGTNIALANCGIQGGLSGGTDGGGNVDLSSSNTATTGPNFVNTSSDFHINAWISPLIDGGTTSYSGVTAPTTDKDGISRISTTDIGAYEFIYYRWAGTVSETWTATGNWSGSLASIPTTISGTQVIIPNGCTYYPTASTLTLSSGSRMIVDAQASLTVTGSTTVDGGCTFTLKSDAASSANFITGSSVSGSFDVELYLTGGTDPTYNWHWVTTPVDGNSKTALTSGIGNTNNLLNYLESAVSTDKNTGWQWHDGFSGTTGFTNLYNKRGYNVLLRNLTSQAAVFQGTILSGSDFTFSNDVDLTCGAGSASGWNLIGNPFTSGVDSKLFTFGANVDPIIYYTSGNNYAYYNTYTDAFTSFATNRMPGMQGFFVHTSTGSDKNLTIPASSRDYSTSPIYKGAKIAPEYPVLKFNISDGGTLTDEAIVYFFKDATTGVDRNYDAYKMLSENPAYPQIYTIGNNINFAMNGLPFPAQKTEVPLNIRIGESKNYTINVLKLDNLSDYKVTLVDGDKRIDLKTFSSYSFFAGKGVISNMVIVFENTVSGVTVPEEDQTACWYSNGAVRIKAGQAGYENNSRVLIYDLNGKVVFSKNNVSLGRGEIIDLPVTLTGGMYITEVINNNKKFVKKIVITY